MIKNLRFALLFLLVLPLTINAQIKLATYNIRAESPKDTLLDSWAVRKTNLAQLVIKNDFDILGIQEAVSSQSSDLKILLPEYTFIALDEKDRVPRSRIFYKTRKFRLIDKGNFWLAPNPSDVKRAWDAKLPRNCSWAHFEDINTGKKFFYFNTHLDHKGEEAKRNSIALIMSKIKELAGKQPFILSGDFNFGQDDPNYINLTADKKLRDSYTSAKSNNSLNMGTFNSFDLQQKSSKRIDHIFVSPSLDILTYQIITKSFGGHYPSDHFPVVVEVIIK